MRQMRHRLGLAVLVLLALGPADALGTTVPQSDLEDLLSRSALVFVGRVLEVDPYAYDEAEETPTTFVAFEVTDALYGRSPKTNEPLEFFIPGGFYPDGRFLRIEASPLFVPGESYLVFVRAGEWNLTPVTNWSHSVFQEIEVEGRRVFVDQKGRGVTGVRAQGFTRGDAVTRGSAREFFEFADPNHSEQSVERPRGPETAAQRRQARTLPDAASVKAELRRHIREFERETGRRGGSSGQAIVHSRAKRGRSVPVAAEEE